MSYQSYLSGNNLSLRSSRTIQMFGLQTAVSMQGLHCRSCLESYDIRTVNINHTFFHVISIIHFCEVIFIQEITSSGTIQMPGLQTVASMQGLHCRWTLKSGDIRHVLKTNHIFFHPKLCHRLEV